MAGNDILMERQGAIGLITLNRAERRNAIRYAGWQGLAAAVRALGTDPTIRVIVIRGAGEEAFASGADISEFPTFRSTHSQAAVYHDAVTDALAAISNVEQPVIAMIHGYCIGGGCELAVACDLRIADEHSRFGIPSAKLGVVLGVEELRALLYLVGMAAAKDILLSGRILDAAEALRIGLVNQIVPRADLLATTMVLAERIASHSPVALASTKVLLDRIAHGDNPYDIATTYANFNLRASASAHYQENVRAFLEKRPPRATDSTPQEPR